MSKMINMNRRTGTSASKAALRAPGMLSRSTIKASICSKQLKESPVLATSCSQSCPRSKTLAVSASVSEATVPSTSVTDIKQYYALVANADFFFNDVQNESLAEQLRERVRFFKEIGREIDFWFIPEPVWLDSKYSAEAKMVRRPCVALVSTDQTWITYMKLRLDRVLRINLGAVSEEEALAIGGKVPEFRRPEKWTAPYSPYTPGWWNAFIPSTQK
ncbi:hypothetical protein CEUSTIGMA_g13539.t1 [Chlamydomonas eustigma]|uniref:Ycf54-like protein n=1 Tax=Chlamydomonas eustigma TaxID=1157962 RepID=A0A250XSW1_9CHLO|nr:hypothetical protein CEUSTIGMA_g13539.t1 [Chlamydomonas eustigma]|eukprot:GAX86126.1 hypothetical protein CEUSTIGMA_g13539.t1 [Chlamydomonas eustigma]